MRTDMSQQLTQAPAETLVTTTEGEHERFSHIILEGWKPEEGDFVSVNNSVVEATIYGTPVKALCGKIWVPGRDPKRYPLCPTCKEIATEKGWKIPSG